MCFHKVPFICIGWYLLWRTSGIKLNIYIYIYIMWYKKQAVMYTNIKREDRGREICLFVGVREVCVWCVCLCDVFMNPFARQYCSFAQDWRCTPSTHSFSYLVQTLIGWRPCFRSVRSQVRKIWSTTKHFNMQFPGNPGITMPLIVGLGTWFREWNYLLWKAITGMLRQKSQSNKIYRPCFGPCNWRWC